MKIKKDLEVSSDDFWYDLTSGYLKPEEILEDSEDIAKVREAIDTLMDFEASCDEQIEGFVR